MTLVQADSPFQDLENLMGKMGENKSYITALLQGLTELLCKVVGIECSME